MLPPHHSGRFFFFPQKNNPPSPPRFQIPPNKVTKPDAKLDLTGPWFFFFRRRNTPAILSAQPPKRKRNRRGRFIHAPVYAPVYIAIMSKFGAMVMGPAGAGKVWACLFVCFGLALCVLTPDHKVESRGLVLVLMPMMLVIRRHGNPSDPAPANEAPCTGFFPQGHRCYAMLSYAMLSYAMLSYAILCHAIPDANGIVHVSKDSKH